MQRDKCHFTRVRRERLTRQYAKVGSVELVICIKVIILLNVHDVMINQDLQGLWLLLE